MSQNLRKSSKRGSKQTPSVSEENRMKVGGKNPYTLKADSEKWLRLFEKIRRFYVKYTDGNRIKNGIGEIVEWTSIHGEPDLNAKLSAKYKGFDLTSLKKMEEEEAKLVKRRINNKKTLNTSVDKSSTLASMSKMLSMPSRRFMKFEEVEPDQAASEKELSRKKREEEIRAKVIEFYQKHAPKATEETIEKVISYGVTKGVAQLNLKLQKKFGLENKIELDDPVDSDDENPISKSSTHGGGGGGNPKSTASGTTRGVSFSKLLHDVEKEREHTLKQSAKSFKPMASTRDLVASSIAPPTRRYQDVPIANAKRLPPQLRMFLKLYYAVYDPQYIVHRKISQVEAYAKTNGYDAIDQALTTKYKESLSEFQARVELVQDKLHGFYLEIDIKRTNDSLMLVLQWTMRNGLGFLNSQLRRKYGCDLNTYQTAAEPVSQSNHDVDDFEPEF